MQCYLYATTISAIAFLGCVVLELLGRPIKALFDLRRKVLRQILVYGNISFPKPRETAVTSREIHEYDEAMRSAREAQRVFSTLGSKLLAFSENEPAACSAMASFGFNSAAAGSDLVRLSVAFSRSDFDRARLCNQIKKSLRLTDPAHGTSRQCPGSDRAIEYQAHVSSR
jgi:hypothetical protein